MNILLVDRILGTYNAKVKQFQKRFPDDRITLVSICGCVAGFRADLIILLTRPITGREFEWVGEDLLLRLSPGGLFIESH